MKKLFLLGGHDLEMLAIGQMLEGRQDCAVADRQLRWDNAVLSTYKDILDGNRDCDIYGIELREDMPVPAGYHRIDHHNDLAALPSSLEQVAAVLGVQPDRRQQLIAANDKGYIPAMKAMGATDEEIWEIRLQDRQAQGVTEEDERLAETSIAEHLEKVGDTLFVRSLTPRFPAVCDRLFPYQRLVVYTDTQWVFYGEGKERLAEELSDDIAAGRVYHGGGPSGYIGAATGAFKEKEILGFVTKLKHRFAYSFHTFMFPFQWRINGYDEKMFSEQISLGNILYSTESDWERSTKPDNDDEANDLYNERNYFYKFVHDALYDSGKDNSLIRHFERTKPRHSGVTYVIDCGKKVYELKVAAINLNLYSTGVGLLSFYLYNESYPEPEDVFRINQVGRRVFPPFFASVKGQRSIIAEAIEICGLNGGGEGYREDFKLYTNEMPNQPASFIENLIHEVATNIDIKPVIDDRMFVLCWYKNDEWAKKFSEDRYDGMLYSSDWYEFVFVDDLGQMSCQNDAMQRELIQKATYSRWQKWCSIYGMSRYSLVYLTNNGAAQFAPYLLGYFETQYVRMAELILVQKASVLRFSAEVTNLSNMETSKGFSGKVSSLYKEYIRFINQIHFREVSAQDQGIEMYQMLYDTMNLKTHVEKLDEEIGELYNYVSLTEDRKSGNTMSLLTWIATISVPVTMITGIFGMNNSLFCCDVPNSGWYNDGRAQLILAFGLAALISIVLYIIYNYRKSK